MLNLQQFRTDTKNLIEYADPEQQQAKMDKQSLDIMEVEGESDGELAERILRILDKNDRVKSYHVIATILNTDSQHPRYQKVMKFKCLK